MDILSICSLYSFSGNSDAHYNHSERCGIWMSVIYHKETITKVSLLFCAAENMYFLNWHIFNSYALIVTRNCLLNILCDYEKRSDHVSQENEYNEQHVAFLNFFPVANGKYVQWLCRISFWMKIPNAKLLKIKNSAKLTC